MDQIALVKVVIGDVTISERAIIATNVNVVVIISVAIMVEEN